MKKLLLFLSAVAAMFAVSCNKDNPVKSITFHENNYYTTEGKTCDITMTVSPAQATSPITWTSSNPDVASIVGGALMIGKYGVTTLTASSNGVQASCTLTVYASLFRHQWYCTDDRGATWLELLETTSDGKGKWLQYDIEDGKAVNEKTNVISYTNPSPGKYVIKIDGRPKDTFNINYTAPDAFDDTWPECESGSYTWQGKVQNPPYEIAQ